MQCVNCGFENMPGLVACVRCQSGLALDSVAIEPPRRARRSLRSWVAVARRSMGLRVFGLRRVLQRLSPWAPSGPGPVGWSALCRSVLPGWGHMYEGRRQAGCVLLGAWLVLLVVTLLGAGLAWSWWCFGALVLVHAAAVLSLLATDLVVQSLGARLVMGVMIFLGLRLGLYMPAQWLAGRFYQVMPVEGLQAAFLIRNGDVLLHEGSWRRPRHLQRGDLCVYRVDRLQVPGGYAVGGFLVDRVVGVPGDRIDVARNNVVVNGQPLDPSAGPVAKLPDWGTVSFRLEKDEYAILPSLMMLNGYGNWDLRQKLLEGLSRVQDSEILGRVVLRIHPWRRFGEVE